MPGRTGVYRFGPFQFDAASGRLTRGRRRAMLSKRAAAVLARMLSCPGKIVSKDALTQAGWGNQAVGPNSIEKAVSSLRDTLGLRRDGSHYIETAHREGYRLTGPVHSRDVRLSDDELDAQIAPHLVFTGGRPLLEKMHLSAALDAIEAIGQVLLATPGYVKGHVAIACAYLFVFESTRADAEPDRASLDKALHHALEARTRAPRYGEAWATLGVVLHRMGQAVDAIAALHEALALDEDNWRHHLRLASVSWGEERLRAACAVRRLCPGLAFADWFSATVFVARQAFGDAADALEKGCAAQDAQNSNTGRFNAVGLHFLRGLVLARAGELDAALAAFERELAGLDDRLLYARECRANTWYAIGGIRFRQGGITAARAAFQQAVTHVPGHALASIGVAWTLPPSQRGAALLALHARASAAQASGAQSGNSGANGGGDGGNIVIAKAVALVLQGKHDEAAGLCHEFLLHAEPGSAGWLIPVDPLLHVTAQCEAWAQPLATLRDRAA